MRSVGFEGFLSSQAAQRDQREAVHDRKQLTRLIVSCFIGTGLEAFDFFLYALFTPLVFNRVFFPQLSPAIATVASLGVFAVGFLSRPLGGVFFGHFGDRHGRKPTMIITLSLMGVVTAAIGLIPGYDSIGIWAPILLTALRFLQGFAFGAENSVAPVFLSEASPRKWRGGHSSWPQSGILAGTALAALVAEAAALMPAEEMLAWGWRVPFILSLVVVGIGLYIRLKVEESPVFVARMTATKPHRIPLLELLRSHKKPTFIAIFVSIGQSGIVIFTMVFGVSYAINTLHVAKAPLIEGLLIGNVIGAFMVPVFGYLCDIVGRRPVMASCFLCSALFVCFGFFELLQTGDPVYIMLATAVSPAVLQPLSLGPSSSFYSELFADARVRFTGVAFGKQIGNVLGGGILPVAAASMLVIASGNLNYVLALYAALNIIAIAATYSTSETKNRPMS